MVWYGKGCSLFQGVGGYDTKMGCALPNKILGITPYIIPQQWCVLVHFHIILGFHADGLTLGGKVEAKLGAQPSCTAIYSGERLRGGVQLVTGDQMRGYGMVRGVPFPSGVGHKNGLCPSQ